MMRRAKIPREKILPPVDVIFRAHSFRMRCSLVLWHCESLSSTLPNSEMDNLLSHVVAQGVFTFLSFLSKYINTMIVITIEAENVT